MQMKPRILPLKGQLFFKLYIVIVSYFLVIIHTFIPADNMFTNRIMVYILKCSLLFFFNNML